MPKMPALRARSLHAIRREIAQASNCRDALHRIRAARVEEREHERTAVQVGEAQRLSFLIEGAAATRSRPSFARACRRSAARAAASLSMESCGSTRASRRESAPPRLPTAAGSPDPSTRFRIRDRTRWPAGAAPAICVLAERHERADNSRHAVVGSVTGLQLRRGHVGCFVIERGAEKRLHERHDFVRVMAHRSSCNRRRRDGLARSTAKTSSART